MSEELKEIKWFNPFDKKMHSVKINNDSEGLDFNEILQNMEQLSKTKENECKKIYYLGVALTGSNDGGRGFLDGWLMRSLRESYERENGKWSLIHNADQLSNDEVKSYFVNMLRSTADKLESEDDFDPKNAPVVKRDNGTELFD